jgi:hypothetical protein
VAAGSAIILVWAWTRHTDELRQLSPIGSLLTPASLKKWVFGSWAQLFGGQLWGEIVPRRMLPQILGYGWPALLICIRYVRPSSPQAIVAALCGVLFLVPIVLFTNVHIVHDYYQTANSIFLVAAVALVLSDLIEIRKFVPAALVASALLAGAVAHVRYHEWPVATGRHDYNPIYVSGRLVRNSTPEDSALVFVGLGMSPEVHYYAERKGIALPEFAPPKTAAAILANPDAYMGGLATRAVVDCRPVFANLGHAYPPELNEVIDRFVESWKQQSHLAGPAQGSCDVYVKQRM